MITLYRNRTCPAGDAAEQRLQELTLAHKVVWIDDPAAGADGELPSTGELPALWDDGKTYAGSAAVQQHLEQLAALKTRWDQFGSDACYCDDRGDIL